MSAVGGLEAQAQMCIAVVDVAEPIQSRPRCLCAAIPGDRRGLPLRHFPTRDRWLGPGHFIPRGNLGSGGGSGWSTRTSAFFIAATSQNARYRQYGHTTLDDAGSDSSSVASADSRES
jgi:hypothetical protein